MRSLRQTARQRELARNQLEHVVAKLRPMAFSLTPPKGWVRAIRDALGMTAEQLAERMKVTRQRIAAIEHSEITGATTLDTLRRAAAAMDCALVYAFVPTRPLEEIVRQKARDVAVRRLRSVFRTMALENQAVSVEDQARELDQLADDILRDEPRELWRGV